MSNGTKLDRLRHLTKQSHISLEDLLNVVDKDLLAKAQPQLDQREQHATLAYLRQANVTIEAECQNQRFVNNEIRALVDAKLRLKPVDAGTLSPAVSWNYIELITEQYLCGILNLEEKTTARKLMADLILADSRGQPLEVASTRFVQFLIDNMIVMSTPTHSRGGLRLILI